MSSDAETPPGLADFHCDCGDYESVISPTAYLADLVDYAAADEDGYGGHLYAGDDAVTIPELDATFYQPFERLAADTGPARETARHVRIAVESLLGFLADDGDVGTDADPPAASATAEYRLAAYEALLDALDCSREDLRDAAYDESDREWVADAVGVPEDRVTDLRLDPDAPLGTDYDPLGPDDATYPVSEANLEALFGLPRLIEDGETGRTPADPLRTIEEPFLRVWRREYLREEWSATDHPEDPFPRWIREDSPYDATIGATPERPTVDPDLIGPDDLRPKPTAVSEEGSGATLPDPGVPEPTEEFDPPSDYVGRTGAFPERPAALALWEVRREWMDEQLEALWRDTPAGPGSTSDVAAMLNGMLDPPSYRSRTGETVWYAGHAGRPTDVPSATGAGAPGADPLAGKGFLEDFARLHTQLTGEAEPAREARAAGAASQYPTGDADDDPASAARTVVEEELHLDQRAFVRLVGLLRTHYGDGEQLDDEAWWEVASILAGARKRSCADAWIAEESDFEAEIDGEPVSGLAVQLDRTHFWQAPREPGEGEWSFRLDRHDPADPDADPEPYVDPERTSRSELADAPHGEAARALYDQRRETLADRREELAATLQRERRSMQADFESFASTYRSELQSLRSQLPDSGQVPDSLAAQSPIDPALDTHYGSVSWPDPSWTWERRFEWLSEGLRLARERDRSSSSLSSAERQHAGDAEAKLEALGLTEPAFEQLATLREQAKPLPPEEQGLTDDQLGTAFATVPTGNPLGPVLTSVFDSLSGATELQDVFDDRPPRWDPLFASIRRSLEEQTSDGSGSSGASSGGQQRPPALEILTLTAEEFETVLSLRRQSLPAVEPEAPSEALVDEVIALLTSVWKRLEKYDASGGSGWIAEEEQAGVEDYWDAYRARLPPWRGSTEERSAWQEALFGRSTAPIVDPDLLEGVSDFEPPAHDGDGFALWEDRRDELEGEHGTGLVYEVEQLRLAAERDQSVPSDLASTKLDASIRRTVGLDLETLRSIARRMERGDEVGAQIARVDLTPAGLTHLLEVDDALGSRPVRVEEWASVAQILLRAWKHRQYGRWNREERARGVLLEPDQFSLPPEDADRSPPADDDPRSWRVEWSVRTQWMDTLETRIDQWEGVDDEIDEAVAAAEREALSILREQLLDRIDEPSASASDAEIREWVSERLLIDVEMTPDRDTTRTSQAITSLQNLVESIDLSLDDDSGLDALDLSIDDAHFDQRWRWLGTYAKWKAAMGVYVYPQNVLLPTLRRRTTERFDDVASDLSQTADLTPAAASAAAQEYADYVRDVSTLQPEAGAMAPGPTVAQRGEDDPAALAYVFAESDESGNAYFLAFDPESQYQPATPDDDPEWPDNSTWNRIPVEAVQSARGIHAAATYRDSIYLFVTTTKDAGSESDGGQGGGTGSEDGEGSGSGDTLGYVTYDPRADRWSELTEIEFPETAPLDGAAVEVSWREHYHSISPVLRAGWNEPPELYVTRSGEGDFGLEPFGFFVALEDDGTAPDTEAIREDSVGTLPGRYGPKRIVAYDSSHRTLFYTRAAHVVDRRSGTVVTDVDYADLADDSVGYAFDVFVRPTSDDAFVVGYDDGGGAVTQVRVSGTGLTHGQTDAVTHALGGTARHGRSLVHCNNAVTRPLERISHSNEVVVTAASPGDDPEHVLQVDPAVVGRSKSIGERRALAPAVPDASQDDHPWRLAIDPGEAGESREETTRRQRDRIDDVRANTARTQQVYLEEANYFLPLLIARQLTRAGEYESALDWYRCIYDHTRDTPEERAIWPPLAPDSGEPDAPSSPLSRWLLDPIDPHGLAAARASGPDEWGQAYTQFTLFSLARCLSDYGDAQFATDTAETVAMATDLYEQALDVLELGPLSPGIDHCGDLIERLESALETHVFDLEVWTEQPGLTRAGAESRADRIVTVAREIDRYVDREEAVAEITDAVAEEGLTAALGVANEWADRERAEREYRDRRSEASQVLREFVRRRPDLEPRLVETATAVAELQRAPVAVAGGGGDGSSIGGGGAGGSGSGGGAGGSGGSGSGGSSGGPDPSGEATAASTAGLSTPAWLDDEVAASVSPANLDAAGVVEPVGSAEVEYEHDDYAGPVTVVDEEDVVVDVDVDFEETDDDAVSDVAVDRGTLDVLEANRHRFCIPDNPLLDSLRRHAEVNLEKIREGRNIAGMKRELDPYASDVSIESAAPTPGGVAGAGVEFQPTDYRYETLLSRAKDLAEQARQFESQYRTAIEQGVSERRKLKRARQKVDLAEERVSLQEVRMERARSKVELARLKRERAVLKRDRYKQWIENPLVSKERAAIDKLQQAVTLQRTAADLQIGATVAHGVAAGLHVAAAAVYGTGGKAGQAVSSSAAASSSIAAGLSSAASVLTTDASKLSTQAQIRQIEARKQRRKRRWKLKRDLAKQNVEIGDQRISIARKTVDVVEAERAVAQLRADHAEDIVNFHEEKFTNRELYDWIAGVLKGVYRYFLQQSASIARMAQRQLAFERQSLPREFVGSDYWDAPTTGQTAVPAAGETGGGSGSGGDETGRRGLTGSARLLQDIYELDQHEFRTEQRRLEVEKTISVAQQDPMALQRFRESGVLSIATELADFDADHPGHYHRMIESVDVTIVALTPPTAGVNATLRNSGTSEIVVGDTIYQERTIDRDPEEIVLNRARGREAGNEIRFRQDDSERLRPFEHSGVATDWELRMPKAANDMDYGTVADVQLTIGYTALDSYDRRQQVLSELDAERGAERAYSFHDDFSDAWYGLLNAPADASSTTVAFETSRDDFPANLQGFTLDTAQLYAVVSGPDRAAQREDLKDLKVTVEPAGGSATKGRATNGTVDLGSLEADDPDQRWELTVTPTGTGDPFADGTIEDLLFLVGGEGTVPSWPA